MHPIRGAIISSYAFSFRGWGGAHNMNAIVRQNNKTMFGLSRLEAIFGKDREIRDYLGIQRLAVKT